MRTLSIDQQPFRTQTITIWKRQASIPSVQILPGDIPARAAVREKMRIVVYEAWGLVRVDIAGVRVDWRSNVEDVAGSGKSQFGCERIVGIVITDGVQHLVRGGEVGFYFCLELGHVFGEVLSHCDENSIPL